MFRNLFCCFISLLLLSSLSVSAQTSFRWADSAAVWHFTDSRNGMWGYEQNSYVGDTTINNQACQKISSQNWGRILTGPFTWVSVVNYTPTPNYYVYKSNDSVFIYKNNSFQLAFKTNATVGEIWDLGMSSYSNQHEYAKVDSVYFSSYNGLPLRNIGVHACKANGDSIVWEQNPTDTNIISLLTVINEKFGPIGGFTTLCAGVPNDIIYCGLPEKLLCYTSSTFSPYQFNSGTDCFNNISTAVPALSENENFKLYPNPSCFGLTISGIHESGIFSLYDATGKEIVRDQLNMPAIQMATERLEKGIYFYTIRTAHSAQNGKWIKE